MSKLNKNNDQEKSGQKADLPNTNQDKKEDKKDQDQSKFEGSSSAESEGLEAEDLIPLEDESLEEHSISIEEFIAEAERLNSNVAVTGFLKYILKNLEEKDFKTEADFEKEEKPLPRKHYLVLSIQFILEKAKELGLDIIFRNAEIYLFNKEYWEKIDEEEFRYFLGEAALKMGVDKFDAKFFKFKEDLYKQFESEGKLQTQLADHQVTLINLKNGTFEISDSIQQLREFRKEDFLTYQLPFAYDVNADPSLFEKFLNEVLPEAELQDILSEYLGSIFIKNDILKLEKALFLYGGGSNGKSVVFDIIGALLGEENFSSYSFESLTKDKDSRAMISDKLLNYCSETSASVQSEIFKKLVSREPIDARKLYKSSFIMTNYARLMFNANELPTDIEHNHAFFRRFLIIPFKVTISEENQDRNLSTKIIKYELPGVFNWILAGMQRLLKNRNFTPSTIVEEEVNRFKRESDSVLSFMDESNYTRSISEEILVNKLFEEYRVYCVENNNRPCSSRTFRRRLENGGFETHRKNTGWIVYAKKSF